MQQMKYLQAMKSSSAGMSIRFNLPIPSLLTEAHRMEFYKQVRLLGYAAMGKPPLTRSSRLDSYARWLVCLVWVSFKLSRLRYMIPSHMSISLLNIRHRKMQQTKSMMHFPIIWENLYFAESNILQYPGLITLVSFYHSKNDHIANCCVVDWVFDVGHGITQTVQI